MSHFGDSCRRLREQARLTQSGLAVKCQLNVDTISRAEKQAICKLRGSTLRKLAQGLGVTTDDLIYATQSGGSTVGTLTYRESLAGGIKDAGTVFQTISGLGAAAFGIEDPTAFAVRVWSDDMEPILSQGDFALVSPRATVSTGITSGGLYLVRLSDQEEPLFRWIVVGLREWDLVASNPDLWSRPVQSNKVASAELVVAKLSLRALNTADTKLQYTDATERGVY